MSMQVRIRRTGGSMVRTVTRPWRDKPVLGRWMQAGVCRGILAGASWCNWPCLAAVMPSGVL